MNHRENFFAFSKLLSMHWLLWALLPIFVACSSSSEDRNENAKMYIVATTGMIADAARNIVQDQAEVEAMMGPGVDPHLYKATRDDLTLLRKADLVLYNGLHLEGKMGEVLEKLARQKPVMAVGEAIDPSLIQPDETGTAAIDPHIWFDVQIWIKVVEQISQRLQKENPQQAEFYQKNAQIYLEKLEKLNQTVQAQIQSIPPSQRVLITAHDAFGYFGKAYEIEVKGLQGISTVSEFGLKDISSLVDFIVERKIKAVFVESSIPRKSLEAVVKGCQNQGHAVKIGGTLFSDAMGEADTPEGTYIGMVRHNVRTIVEGLK